MIDVLLTIVKYRQERGWSEKQLSDVSGVPQTTISSWYRRGVQPQLSSLTKICGAFGITLSQFFAEGLAPVELTEAQARLIHDWARLDPEQQDVISLLISVMQKPIQ